MSKWNSKFGKQNDKNIIQKYVGQCKGKQKGAEFISRVLKKLLLLNLNDLDNTADFVLNGTLIDGVICPINNIEYFQSN